MRMRITLLGLLAIVIALVLTGCGGSLRALDNNYDPLFPEQPLGNDGKPANDFVYPDAGYSGQKVTFEASVPLKQPHGDVEYRWDFGDWAVTDNGDALLGTPQEPAGNGAAQASQADDSTPDEAPAEVIIGGVIGASVVVTVKLNTSGAKEECPGHLTVIVGNSIKEEMRTYDFTFTLKRSLTDPIPLDESKLLVHLPGEIESGENATLRVEGLPEEVAWSYTWDFAGGAIESGASGSGTSSAPEPNVVYINRDDTAKDYTGSVYIWDELQLNVSVTLTFTYTVKPLAIFAISPLQLREDGEGIEFAPILASGIATAWYWDISQLGTYAGDSKASDEMPSINVTAPASVAATPSVTVTLTVANDLAQCNETFNVKVLAKLE